MIKANASSSFAPRRAQTHQRGALQVVAADKRTRPAVADVAEFQKSATDTGSSSVQIALLTKRIEGLTAHLGLFVNTGSRFEDASNFGVSHMTSLMGFRSG